MTQRLHETNRLHIYSRTDLLIFCLPSSFALLQSENPSVSEDLITSKFLYDEMIGELEGRFGLPAGAKLSRSHPLPGGTPVYAQLMDRLDPDTPRWISGTVISCAKDDDVHRYQILFDDDGEDAHCHDDGL